MKCRRRTLFLLDLLQAVVGIRPRLIALRGPMTQMPAKFIPTSPPTAADIVMQMQRRAGSRHACMTIAKSLSIVPPMAKLEPALQGSLFPPPARAPLRCSFEGGRHSALPSALPSVPFSVVADHKLCARRPSAQFCIPGPARERRRDGRERTWR